MLPGPGRLVRRQLLREREWSIEGGVLFWALVDLDAEEEDVEEANEDFVRRIRAITDRGAVVDDDYYYYVLGADMSPLGKTWLEAYNENPPSSRNTRRLPELK